MYLIEGTWEEVKKKAESLRADIHVRLQVGDGERGEPIKFGMFPQLGEVSDADFATAKWKLKSEPE